MQSHAKQRIEKDNFHDSIFNVCIRRIRACKLQSKSVLDIIKTLDFSALLLSRNEYTIIESYNSDDREAINRALSNTISDLLNPGFIYEYSDDMGIDTADIHRYLKETYKSVERLVGDNWGRDINGYMIGPRFRNFTVNRAFKIYYQIVSLIVEDINEMSGWREISASYKREYAHIRPEIIKNTKPLTFLSYAFKDNIYALFLFDMFEQENGFLYVDSLFGTDYGDDGSRIKNALSPWIDNACQILFLHSIHSDKVKKGLSSWCSWELGEAYKSNHVIEKKFYKVVVAGIKEEDKHPIIDDSFLELDHVDNGYIIPKRNRRSGFNQYTACPYCGKTNLPKAKQCISCGASLEQKEKLTELEIEKRAVTLFKNAGWTTSLGYENNRNYRHDIVLSFDNEVVGFVEITKNLSGQKLMHKVQQLKNYIVNEKPKIAVLTNLFTYYVYYDGHPFIEMKHVPTPFEGEFLVDFVKKCLDDMTNKNNGDDNDGRK